MNGFKVPIALFVFNRPNTTQQVFDVVQSLQPRQLLIVSDGCRPDHPEDVENCSQVRAIFDKIDWDCNIKTNYSDINLGCSLRFATGLDWVFDQVDEAIILEDDCLPDITFFRFCEDLLDRYRETPSVTQICGTNRLYEWKSDRQSYHFVYYGTAWGWATWRRAWNYYDHTLSRWSDESVRKNIQDLIDHDQQFAYFSKTCDIDMWDYKWSFAQLSRGGLTIIPAVNLVRNIGFSKQATHTKRFSVTHINSTFKPDSIKFPLIATPSIQPDREYNQRHFLWSVGKPMITCAERVAKRLCLEDNPMTAYVFVNYLLKLYPDSQLIKSVQHKILLDLKAKKR